ncbi:hypothetical protein KSP40_PGU003786 [Platanthera guangdongensis]|uniref:Uncharacterized protein n=1 Tax=Platanthera guangdongensis TaxID=2320717 RepID=A0ABR2M9U2_9ASPA
MNYLHVTSKLHIFKCARNRPRKDVGGSESPEEGLPVKRRLASAPTAVLAIDLGSLLSAFDPAFYSCLPEVHAVQPPEDLSKAMVPFSCCDPSIISAFIHSVTAASDDVTAAAAEDKAESTSEIVSAAKEDNVPTAADEPSSQDFLMTEAVVFEPAEVLPKTNRTQTTVHEDAHSSLLEDSKTSLTVFNFTIEEADLVLKKAFGWNHSPYPGEERRKEAPQLDSIEEMLDYLKSLSLSDDDLHKILKMFPEVLGCSLSEEKKTGINNLLRRDIRTELVTLFFPFFRRLRDSYETDASILSTCSLVSIGAHLKSIPLTIIKRFMMSEERTYKDLLVSEKEELKVCTVYESNLQTAVHKDAHSSLLEDSKTSLTVFNFTIEEADLVLKKAFGWNHSPYRGEERRKEAPQLDSIEEMLDYLKSLSLSDDDLHKVLKMFPEVLGCSLSEELPAIVLVTVNTPCYLFFHQTSSIFGPYQWESSRMRKRAGISSVQNYL